jgi:hypothetical protein
MSVSGGPDWMNRNRYTIEAVAQGNPTDREYRAISIHSKPATARPPDEYAAGPRPVFKTSHRQSTQCG